MTLTHYYRCFLGIVWREALRFFHQRERFLAALVRPLVWLLVFAAGFRAVLGVSIIPPYETYITYEVYIAPGLIAMIQLFNGMQSSLSMVYDREMGSMRTLLVSPLPRWFLLVCKLLAGVAVSILQVYAFLAIAKFGVYFVAPLVLLFGIVWGQPHLFPGKSSIVTWRGFIPVAAGVAVGTWLLLAWLEVPLEFVEIDLPLAGYFTVVAMLIVSGLMLGALGMLLSSWIKQLENFAGIMNFVIFPMFFASSALYPLWKMRESSEILYYICLYNPFTGAVEIIRHALYGQIHWGYLAFTAACTLVFLALAVLGYDPGRGLITRKAGAGAGA